MTAEHELTLTEYREKKVKELAEEYQLTLADAEANIIGADAIAHYQMLEQAGLAGHIIPEKVLDSLNKDHLRLLALYHPNSIPYGYVFPSARNLSN